MLREVSYATREQVADALEIMSTSRSNPLIDNALGAARSAVEGCLHLRFYPELKTVRFDWPNYSLSPSWSLDLGEHRMVSLTTLTAGGVNILSGAFLRRHDELDEPPYDMIQLDISSGVAFQSGTTWQRAINAGGVFGWNDTAQNLPSCALGANINSSVSTVVLNPTSGVYDVGVGSLLLIGTERLLLVDRRMSDTTQNLASNMNDLQNDRVVDVADASGFAIGETILIDAERMRIVDIAGNNMMVDRAWDGTALATHTAPADVYALRTFTVQRGMLGSTAAAHVTTDNVYAHQFPALVNELAIGEAVVLLEQKAAAYARTAGSGANARESAGQGLTDIRNSAIAAFGRSFRSGAV